MLALTVIGIVDISNAYSQKLRSNRPHSAPSKKSARLLETATVEATLANEAVCQVNGAQREWHLQNHADHG